MSTTSLKDLREKLQETTVNFNKTLSSVTEKINNLEASYTVKKREMEDVKKNIDLSVEEKFSLLQSHNQCVEKINKEIKELELREAEEIARKDAEKEELKKRIPLVERKIFLEESPNRDRLGDCFADLTKTPSAIVQEHRKLISTSDDYDNSSKRYMHENKVYEICCKRELILFSHKCKITVYEIL